MAIIDPNGLFSGDRLRKCSNQSRLLWPYLFLASNGFGRLEINYPKIVGKAFIGFDPQPSQADIERSILEYHNAYLLYLYEAPNGQVWGQWDTRPALLKKHKTAEDHRSPAPIEEEFRKWLSVYEEQKKSNGQEAVSDGFKRIVGNFGKSAEISGDLLKPQETSGDLPLGVGVGVVVGDGDGREREAPSNLDEQVSQIFRENPANESLVAHGKLCPADQERAIAEAIMEDGFESVLVGTRNLRDAFAPRTDKQFIPNPLTFYKPGNPKNYLADPVIWRKEPKRDVSPIDREPGRRNVTPLSPEELERVLGNQKAHAAKAGVAQ